MVAVMGLVALLLIGRLLLFPPAPSPLGSALSSVERPLSISAAISKVRANSPSPFPGTAIPLQMGLHLKNIYNLRPDSQTFSADGWYWLEWSEPLNRILIANDLKPVQMVEFLNQVETWDSQIQAETAEPLLLPDGRRYQLYRFSARFYIDAIDERHSPFETVVLPVVAETRPEPFALNRDAVKLQSDPRQQDLVGSYGELSGYRLKGASVQEAANSYDIFGKGQQETFSQLVFRVTYGTEPWAAFMKWILPPLIVMIIVLLAPSLESSLGEIRVAIPSTALLTLVFLQQTYKAQLPSTPYLTFLDELYTYCYLVAVGLFVLFLWSSNRMEAAAPEQREWVRLRLNRIDFLGQWGALAGLVLVVILAWHF